MVVHFHPYACQEKYVADKAKSFRLTQIPGLSLIATLMALAGLIKMGVDFGQYNASVSVKDTFAKTVCCPSTATSYLGSMLAKRGQETVAR